jgi:hypothetical protein
MPQHLLTNEELEKLIALKRKWPPEQILKENFEAYEPNNIVLSQWMYQRWRYRRKLLNDGR